MSKDISLGTLYDLNKRAIIKEKPMSLKQIKKKEGLIFDKSPFLL